MGSPCDAAPDRGAAGDMVGRSVLFPVDCVDHQSMTELKRHCTRYGVPYHPLRTASVASFVATVQRLDATGQAQPGAQRTRVSRFCLRHG